MSIIFSDEGGLLLVSVDEYGIAFSDGLAYFSDGDREYQIPLSSIREIR